MLKFGIVGCGRIAKRHCELLSRDEIQGARLQAVCDVVPSRARQFSETYGVKGYSSLKEMMESERVDVLSVLTPSGDHAQNVFEAFGYNIPLIVEKPMALRLEDARRMFEESLAREVPLFVVKQNRFNVPVVKLRQELEAGRFGKLVMGTIRVRWSRDQAYYDQAEWRGTWRGDGGVFTNQASHHVDLLQWMMGDWKSVYAVSRTALVNIEAEDTGVAVIEFENGALGVIEATTAIRPKDLEGSLTLLGEAGSVEISGFAVNQMKHWNFSHPTQEDIDVLERFSVNPPNVYGFGHRAYLNEVTKSLRGEKSIAVSASEGLKSLELIHAIYQSIEQGKKITKEEFFGSQKLGRGNIL